MAKQRTSILGILPSSILSIMDLLFNFSLNPVNPLDLNEGNHFVPFLSITKGEYCSAITSTKIVVKS